MSVYDNADDELVNFIDTMDVDAGVWLFNRSKNTEWLFFDGDAVAVEEMH